MSGLEIQYVGLTMRFGFQPGQRAEDLLAIGQMIGVDALAARVSGLNVFSMDQERIFNSRLEAT